MSELFKEVKESIDQALEEIKKVNPELYEYLKQRIFMDEKNNTICYKSK